MCRSNWESGKYVTYNEFLSDVKLVFENALLYNVGLKGVPGVYARRRLFGTCNCRAMRLRLLTFTAISAILFSLCYRANCKGLYLLYKLYHVMFAPHATHSLLACHPEVASTSWCISRLLRVFADREYEKAAAMMRLFETVWGELSTHAVEAERRVSVLVDVYFFFVTSCCDLLLLAHLAALVSHCWSYRAKIPSHRISAR